MSFTDFTFLLFLAVTAGVCGLCPKRFRSALLLIASYLYCLTWSAPAACLLAAATALTFVAGIATERARKEDKRAWAVPASVAMLVGYLLAFKIALLTPARGIAGVVMPIGISYATFKLISYILEIYWDRLPACRSIVAFAGYAAFFPQILAGPIQRPADYFDQLPPVPSRIPAAIARIAWGLAKKLIVADSLAPVVSYVYQHVTGLSGVPLWLGFYLYPLQLYADFSGLTDIAIGAGQLFGITGPENFDRPFTASSISEFWRRWHMSLTNWLNDYVFVPLRMSVRAAGKAGLAFSITVTMVSIGLWHGLTATYLVFGLLHSLFMTVDALTSRQRARFFKLNPAWEAPARWFGCLLTFHLVATAMVFFRAGSVTDATWLLSHLFSRLSASAELLRALVNTTGARTIEIGLIGYALLELAERYQPFLISTLWQTQLLRGPRWVRWSARCCATILLIFGLTLLLAHSDTSATPFLYAVF